jgi:hypothetical protein
MATFLVTMKQSDGLLHLHPFEVEAADKTAAIEAADRHMRDWRDYIARGAVGIGGVPNAWTIEKIEQFDRQPLTARNARPGAPDLDNPIIISLGDREIARLVMDAWDYSSTQQSMTLRAKVSSLKALDGTIFHDNPGACRARALAAIRERL